MEAKSIQVAFDVGEGLPDIVPVELLVLSRIAIVLEAFLNEIPLRVRKELSCVGIVVYEEIRNGRHNHSEQAFLGMVSHRQIQGSEDVPV